MAFHEVQFPVGISIGTSGGPGHSTSIIRTDSGAEERVGHWSGALRQYQVVIDQYSPGEYATIIDFVLARRGALHGFRLKDWTDYATTASNVTWDGSVVAFTDATLGIGDGVLTQFQLRKPYGITAFEVFRNITKPIPGTVKVGVGGIQIFEGANFSVDYTTGIVTTTPAVPLGQVIKAGCEYDVPVRFGEDADRLVSGKFVAGQAIAVDRLEMIEILDESTVFDAHWVGGSKDHGSTAVDISISLGQGRVHVITPTVDTVNVRLPTITTVPEGGPLLYIHNASSSLSFALRDASGVFVTTVVPLFGVMVFRSQDAAGVNRWHAFRGANITP